MKTLQTFRVSLHGHGPDSDGMSSITDVVEAAGRSKIDFLGLADHNTTSGIPALYRKVAEYNRDHEHQIQAVGGIEIHFTDGDIIFSKPGPIDSAFLSWCESIAAKRKTMGIGGAINQAVRRYGAIVTIPHVDAPLAGSLSGGRLGRIMKKLPPGVRRNVSLEVRNYATQVFWILTVAREERLDRLAGSLGLATVGFSDFHHSWMVKKQVSIFEAGTGTARALTKAIRGRTIRASYRESLGLFEWIRLVWTLCRALTLYKMKNADWSLPAFRPQPAMQ